MRAYELRVWKTLRYTKYIALILILALLLCGCGKEEPVDPYAGMAQVETGYGTKMWIRPIEGLPVNEIGPEDFSDGVYIGGEYDVIEGIDVSEHQGVIDWDLVAADGIDFAIIRAGYRGYSQGGLFMDNYFYDNLHGAKNAGLDIGLYFFSQAITVEEAVEEAQYLLKLLEDCHAESIDMPIFYDWESIGNDEARTDGLGGDIITDCALAFSEVISAAGYEAGVYFYRNLGYFSYDLGRLTNLTWWAAALNDYPDFYYEHYLWQYDVSGPGSVDGIEGEVDRNKLFIPIVTEEIPEV